MAKKTTTVPENIEIVVSFDTTGSMYPCLTQVRREVERMVNRLFDDVPGLKMGIIAHGDYCDKGSTYVTKRLDLTGDRRAIGNFVRNVEPTGGGDAPECYELVLNEARSLSWSAGKSKVLVLIGDDVPHGPKEAQNTKHLDWRNELDLLLEAGIHVYGVQALARGHATAFYKEIAKKTGGFHLELHQFQNVVELIYAVGYKQVGDTRLQQYETEISKAGRMNRSLDRMFGEMLGRKASTTFAEGDLRAVNPSRFQVLHVDDDTPIADFVRDQGLRFKTGRGFYELTKPVLVQSYKEVVLVDKRTGDMFSGERARELVGLPEGENAKIKPVSLEKFTPFIQSTSNNRKLIGGTRFLYEVEDWGD